jgi:hypothetical protein
MILNIQNTEEDNILFNFDSVYDFIEQGLEKGAVLVHSEEGLSRSPVIIMAYLIKKKGISYDQANDIVIQAKPHICPNDAFVEHLKLFEKNVKKVIENVYKCSICRKTFFNDSNIDFVHEFTPKSKYSYKRYKKSFVTSNECSSYFLNSLNTLNLQDIGQKLNCPNKNVYVFEFSAITK